ncbi:MAG: hypothetical protein IT380_29120 [Myxococcales bacterium]|nr:hypothetical protein [Myxococcales bacterium]
MFRIPRWLWLVLSSSLAPAAWAQDCPRPQGPATTGAVSGQGAKERLAWLSQALSAEAPKSRRWLGAWGATYGLLTVGQLSAVGFTDNAADPDWYVGALTSALGLAFTLVSPPEAQPAAPGFAQKASRATEADTCLLVAEGERLLREGAASQTRARAWYLHVLNVAANVGLGLVLGLAHDRWVPGVVNFALGVGLIEATLFTAPTGLVDAWDEYRGAKRTAVRFFLGPGLAPGGAGVRWGFSF